MSAPVFLNLDSENDTARLGRAIAASLAPGMLVLLKGDLGTGKTALARTIVRALVGDPELDVPSPSFALVQPYERGDGTPVLHADFYRLADATETHELGLFDDPRAMTLVEWPERDPGLAADADLVVELTQGPTETARKAALTAPGGRLDCAAIAASVEDQ